MSGGEPTIFQLLGGKKQASSPRAAQQLLYTSPNAAPVRPDMATTEMEIIAVELSRKDFESACGVIHNTCLLGLRRFFKNAPVCSGMKSAKLTRPLARGTSTNQTKEPGVVIIPEPMPVTKMAICFPVFETSDL